MIHSRRRIRRASIVIAVTVVAAALLGPVAAAAAATSYVPISGAGSSWSSNAIDQWRRNVQQYGMRINYASTGSSDGRNQFKSGTVDFAASEIPYGLKDNGVVEPLPSRGFAYMPSVAGGTSFMYNLQSGGQRITNLRLSGDVIAKIFTGVITRWDDPAIKADNPGLTLPERKIVPVVRSDGSGSTAQFSLWMSKLHSSVWNVYCAQAGRANPCGMTSNFPVVFGKGFVAQPNSQGVAGYVAQAANIGTITYVEYSYAIKTGYPVAKVLNSAGYYVEPTASNVAVALLGAKINTDSASTSYLTQELSGVYSNPDPRTYPLSSYSYVVVPTQVQSGFSLDKGKTLAAFANYFLCEGQQQAEVLGYSPLPINLVKAGLDQVKRIPGAVTSSVNIANCHNPTFSTNGTNTLAAKAPQPSACDKKGVSQCNTGTGGAKGTTMSTTSSTGTGSTGSSAGTGTTPDAAGTGTSPGGGTVGAVATTSDGRTSCDPDTGQCSVVVAIPVTAPAPDGWGINQSLILGVVVAVALLIFGPPLVVLIIGRGRRS